MTLIVERSKSGLFFITCEEVRGLLIAAVSLSEGLSKVPAVLDQLAKAGAPHPFPI